MPRGRLRFQPRGRRRVRRGLLQLIPVSHQDVEEVADDPDLAPSPAGGHAVQHSRNCDISTSLGGKLAQRLQVFGAQDLPAQHRGLDQQLRLFLGELVMILARPRGRRNPGSGRWAR